MKSKSHQFIPVGLSLIESWLTPCIASGLVFIATSSALSQESVVALPPAFAADNPTVHNALSDVREAVSKRANRLEEAELRISEAATAYRENRSDINFARIQRALADFLSVDLNSRHEVAHVATEAAASLHRFSGDLDRVEDDHHARTVFLQRRWEQLNKEGAQTVARLRQAGISHAMLEDPSALSLEHQEMVLGAVQHLESLESTAALINELESRAEGNTGEFAAYREAVLHDAMQLRLLSARARAGLGGIRLVAESIQGALDLIAIRETMRALDQNRAAWQGIRFQPLSPTQLGPRPLTVPVPANISTIQQGDAAIERLATLLRDAENGEVHALSAWR